MPIGLLHQEDKARKLARDLADFVNCMSRTEHKVFVEALASEHLTLQQSATGLMLLWFKHLSEVKHGDLRNEHARHTAKVIRRALEDLYGSAWYHMPLI